MPLVASREHFKDFPNRLHFVSLNLVHLVSLSVLDLSRNLGINGLRGFFAFFHFDQSFCIFVNSLDVSFSLFMMTKLLRARLTLCLALGDDSLFIVLSFAACFILLAHICITLLLFATNGAFVEELSKGWLWFALGVDNVQSTCLQGFRACRIVEADPDLILAKDGSGWIIYFNKDDWLFVILQFADATVLKCCDCSEDFKASLFLKLLCLLLSKCDPSFGLASSLRYILLILELAFRRDVNLLLNESGGLGSHHFLIVLAIAVRSKMS